jgi:hypothetical protein
LSLKKDFRKFTLKSRRKAKALAGTLAELLRVAIFILTIQRNLAWSLDRDDPHNTYEIREIFGRSSIRRSLFRAIALSSLWSKISSPHHINCRTSKTYFLRRFVARPPSSFSWRLPFNTNCDFLAGRKRPVPPRRLDQLGGGGRMLLHDDVGGDLLGLLDGQFAVKDLVSLLKANPDERVPHPVDDADHELARRIQNGLDGVQVVERLLRENFAHPRIVQDDPSFVALGKNPDSAGP